MGAGSGHVAQRDWGAYIELDTIGMDSLTSTAQAVGDAEILDNSIDAKSPNMAVGVYAISVEKLKCVIRSVKRTTM